MLVFGKMVLYLLVGLAALFALCIFRAIYFMYKYETCLYKKYPERIKELSISAAFAYDQVKVLDGYMHLFGTINCDDPMLLSCRKKVQWSLCGAIGAWLLAVLVIFVYAVA